MTARTPSLALRARRWVGRAIVGVGVLTILMAGVVALYVSRPESGPGHELLDAIQYPIRQNEDLQYNAHRALGKLFSLCPCTAGLSADQYRRAWFHRPDAETQAN